MSSIQILNQIKSLDTNNNIKFQKNSNTNITEDHVSKHLTEDVTSSIPIDNPMDFLDKEQSTTYTILSPVHGSSKDIEYIDNNIDKQDYIDFFKNNDIDNELSTSDIYSFNEPFEIINDSTNSDHLPIIMIEDEITNIKDNNINADTELTNNIDSLMSPFEETYIVDMTDNNVIKDNIFQKDESNHNPIISSDDIILNDEITPDSQYMIVSDTSKDNPLILDETSDSDLMQTPFTFLNSSDEMKNSINEYQNNFNMLQDINVLDKKLMNAILYS